ncbi:MAG: HDOD domain-containing protein [Deltaproteobacteria bacterium]|jgi:HD-like signal output (HDOD) protein|nr:MAG: HDOD domain-containing protein [Deltaproteobacteria bacterium]
MNKDSNEYKIRRMIQGIGKISTLPTIFAKVNELLNDPTSSAHDLGKVISGDQGLTARLLRLVNSTFYGFPGKIDTVSHAVTIIGFRRLRELVLGTSVLGMFKGLGDNISFRMEEFWKHSLACGVASKVLAVYRREENPESYFVAGLLHDLGRLVLLESYSEKYREVFTIVQDRNALISEAEMDVFGFTHAEVAKELISFWRLPDSLQGAVGHHHNPQGGPASSSYADMVHISNILVHACKIGSSGERFVPPLSPGAWERVGLKKGILEPAFEKIYEQFEDAFSFFVGPGQG